MGDGRTGCRLTMPICKAERDAALQHHAAAVAFGARVARMRTPHPTPPQQHTHLQRRSVIRLAIAAGSKAHYNVVLGWSRRRGQHLVAICDAHCVCGRRQVGWRVDGWGSWSLRVLLIRSTVVGRHAGKQVAADAGSRTHYGTQRSSNQRRAGRAAGRVQSGW